MAKRDKRDVRFSTLKTFYEMHKSSILADTLEESLAKAKQNVQFAKTNSGIILFESELDNFAAKYPSIDMADFTQFLNDTGGLKKAGSSDHSGGERVGITRLNTEESALARGVKPEDVALYLAKVEEIYAAVKVLNPLLGNARCSFAIPKDKVEAEPEVSA